MALYIPASLARISKSVNVTVDLTKLSQRSLNNIYKMMTTGVVTGETANATIALNLLKNHNAPYLHKQSWRISWYDLPDCSFEKIKEAKAMVVMACTAQRPAQFQPYNTLYATGEQSLWSIRNWAGWGEEGDKLVKLVVDHVTNQTIPQSLPVIELADHIKYRRINEVTFNLL